MNYLSITDQIIADCIEEGVSSIKDFIDQAVLVSYDPEYGRSVSVDSKASKLLKMIKENAKDFTSDIASKVLDKSFAPSEKQAWCLAFQVSKNTETYLSLLN